jgi:AmmeMemoRadiSam system protein A
MVKYTIPLLYYKREDSALFSVDDPMHGLLTDKEKQKLLQLARAALERAVHRKDLESINLDTLPKRLQEPGASFVTLTKGTVLRGCIGSIKAAIPLAEDVRQHAVDAALHDYRFPPVKPEEVTDIEIEVSVLSSPKPLDYTRGEDLPELLKPGVDGVIIEKENHRATFLPQVWEKVPQGDRFLDMLCEKAFLPHNAWREGQLQVFTYQVTNFHEGTDN